MGGRGANDIKDDSIATMVLSKYMLYLFEDKIAIVPIPLFPVGIKASSFSVVDKGIRRLKTANSQISVT